MSRSRRFSVLLLLPGLLAVLLLATACPSEEPVRFDEHTARPADHPGLEAQLLLDGWRPLFDGESLAGWDQSGEARWRVETDRDTDLGLLVADGEAVGFLHTLADDFENFELLLDARLEEGGNSGVFLRSEPFPTDPLDGAYEVNLAPPDNPFPTGSLVARERVDGGTPPGPWQRLQITVLGGQILVVVDGETVLEWDDPEPRGPGHIALQSNRGRVEFRNVVWRPLENE